MEFHDGIAWYQPTCYLPFSFYERYPIIAEGFHSVWWYGGFCFVAERLRRGVDIRLTLWADEGSGRRSENFNSRQGNAVA